MDVVVSFNVQVVPEFPIIAATVMALSDYNTDLKTHRLF